MDEKAVDGCCLRDLIDAPAQPKKSCDGKNPLIGSGADGFEQRRCVDGIVFRKMQMKSAGFRITWNKDQSV